MVKELENETIAVGYNNSNGKEKIEIKELEITDKGIRIKYERSHFLEDPQNPQTDSRKVARHKEEGIYPKKGEVSNNYSDRIDEKVKEIAKVCLEICGLTEEVWDNEYLKLTKVCFYWVEYNNRNEISISAKLKSKNELLGKALSFNVPRIPPGAVLEYALKSTVIGLMEDLQDFYNGKVKYEQSSLF